MIEDLTGLEVLKSGSGSQTACCLEVPPPLPHRVSELVEARRQVERWIQAANHRELVVPCSGNRGQRETGVVINPCRQGCFRSEPRAIVSRRWLKLERFPQQGGQTEPKRRTPDVPAAVVFADSLLERARTPRTA